MEVKELDIKRTGVEPSMKGVVPLGPERGASSSLAPTARRILDAAHRRLMQHGYPGLTFDAIAAESGSNKSMIRYYFGSKAGLVNALLDDLIHDDVLQLAEIASHVMSADERVDALMAVSRVYLERSNFNSEFDILPYAVRDEELRLMVAKLWDWYRVAYVRCFGGPEASLDDPHLLALSSIFMAAVDGLAIQIGLQGRGFDQDRAWEVLGQLLKAHVQQLDSSEGPSGGSSSAPYEPSLA